MRVQTPIWMQFIPRLTALVVLCALAATPVARGAYAADAVRPIEQDADNVRSQVGVIDEDLKNAIAKERRYPLDRRYVEAQIAYERGNLGTSSVLLVDLVNNSEFQLTRDYSDALFMLGDALFRMRNFMGAKRYLDPLAKSPTSKTFQQALQLLADISVRLHHMEDVEMYAKRLDSIPSGQRKSELLYQFGRAFFSGKSFERARTFLEQVQRGEPKWPNSRFYMGAILVAQNKPLDALKEFRDVVESNKTKSKDEPGRVDQTVMDYCNLALGRLYLQQKKFDDAVYHYQLVDRNSQVYEEALFELAAAYVAGNKPQLALEALEVLLLTVTDDNVAVQAAVLRGRINMVAKKFEQADAAYQEVDERFSAITGELRRFAESDKNLEQFFTWLLNRNSDEYTVVRPVSDRVAKYIERDEDMQRVVTLFDDMSAERADVKESDKLAKTIDAALRETSRLDMFPALKDSWMRVIEAENKSLEIGRRIVELLRSFAYDRMNPEQKAKADALKANRTKWEEAFAKVPASKGEYLERQSSVDNKFAELSGEGGVLKANLAKVKDDVLSVEKMLNEHLFQDNNIIFTKEKEAALRAELQTCKDELRRAYREIEEYNQDVEIAAQSIGAGDKVSGDEAVVRANLLAAQMVEQATYVGVLEELRDHTEESSRLRTTRVQLNALGEQMHGILRTISARASERIGVIAQVLAVEKRNIAEYQITVRSYEDDARTMARQVGYGLIRAAERRLADILLEAHLGLVDVAWQRMQDKAAAIKDLQEDRAAKLKSLGDVLNNLTTEPEGE